MAKKRTRKEKKRTFDDIRLLDPCPICGCSIVIPDNLTKIEAERMFKNTHTKEECNDNVKINEEWAKSCETCGKPYGGYVCGCRFKEDK